ncbi:two-partner secretion domain-containing protein [Paraburkholderia bannensis]|uniref:two-partner secretion domain-containing protein n=1 Tax=Paraburkholderia bannensis TaxID=765414 RepID=UPI002ABDFB44|nr:adhesin [Paraburkholderia bannensis]
MNASKRGILRQLATARLLRDQQRADTGTPAWLVASVAQQRFSVWQRAVAFVVAITSFLGPISFTFEQGRDAAGVLAAGSTRLDDHAWQLINDLAALRVRFAMQMAEASPIVDPTATITFQPRVTQSTGSGGGVPVVNITAPNAAGISLNQYQSFNIDPVGLILNNSLASGTSLTGGDVAANPNLKGRTASVIVNQVTSTGAAYASLLNGPLEVFGAPATVIVANPNGITTRGTGFTNTIGVTLSTGVPQLLSSAGGTAASFDSAQAIGYDVRGGHIQIEGNAGVNGPGAGIEGTVGTIDLIGATIGVNAPLYAGTRINAIAGQQFVAPVSSDSTGGNWATSANGSGNTAASVGSAIGGANVGLAIDATAYGAMTAGQIALVGTAAGMGVRSDAQLAANAGDVTLSANGDVTLASVAAQKNVNVQASGNATLSGTHIGIESYTLSANGDVHSTGTIETNGALSASAGGSLDVASAQAAGDIALSAGNSASSGDVQTAGNFAIRAQGKDGTGDVTLTGTTVVAGATTLAAARDAALEGSTSSATLQVTGQRNVSVDGETQTSGDLALNAATGNIETTAAVNSNSNLSLSSGQGTTIGAQTTALQAITLAAAAGGINIPGSLESGTNLSATTSGAFDVSGTLQVGADATVNAGSMRLDGTTIVQQSGALNAAADIGGAGAVSFGQGATLTAGNDVALTGQLVANGIQVTAARNLLLNDVQSRGALSATASSGSATLVNAAAIGAASVQAGGDIDINGTFASGASVALAAGRDVNIAATGAVQAVGDVTANAAGSILSGGSLSTGASLAVKAGQDIALTGATSVDAGASLTAGNDVTLGGPFAGQGSGNVTAGRDIALGGSAAFQGDVQVQAGRNLTMSGSLDGANLTFGSGQSMTLHDVQSSESLKADAQGGALTVGGTVTSLSTAQLSSGSDTTVTGTLQSTGRLDMTSGANLVIGGTTTSLSDALLTSGGDASVTGLLQSTGALTLTSGANTTIGGTVLSLADATLTNASGALTSTGTIQAGNDLLIDAAQSVDLGSGQTTAQRDLTLHAGGNLSANGTVVAQRNGEIDAGGTLGGSAKVAFGGAAALSSGGDTNLPGSLSGDTVQVRSGANATLHDVTASSTLSLSAAQDLATTGNVLAGATATLQSGGSVDISGALKATGDIALNAGSSVQATGSLNGGSALAVQAGQDVQLAGATTAMGAVSVTAGRDVTSSGTFGGQAGGTIDAARDIALGGSNGFLGDIQAQAGRNLAVSGSLAGANVTLGSNQSMTLHDVQSSGTLLANALDGTLVVDGATTSLSTAQLDSGSDTLISGQLQSAGRLDVTSGGKLSIDGSVTSLSAAALASTGDASVGGLLQSSGALALTSGANTIIGGTVLSLADATLTNASGSLASTGTIQAGNDLLIDAAQSVDLGTGQTTAQRDLTVHAGGNLTANGTVIGQRNGELKAGGVLAGSAAMSFGQAAILQSGSDTSLTGSLRGDTVQVQAGGSATLHDVTAASALSLSASNDLITTGNVLAGAAATLQAGGNLTVGGSMQAVGDITLNAISGTIQTGGSIAGNGAVALQAAQDIAINGSLGASSGMSLDAGRDVLATGALTVLANDLHIAAASNVSVADVQANGAFDVTARDGDVSFSGTAAALGATSVSAGRDVSVSGALLGGGDGTNSADLATTVQAGRDVLMSGLLGGGTTLDVTAARDVNVGGAGQIQAVGDMTVAATTGSIASQGTIAAESYATFTTGQDLSLTGTTSIGATATLDAGHDLTLGGVVTGKQDAVLTAANDLTVGGSSVFAGDVTAQAGTDLAVTGAIQGQAVSLTATRSIALQDVQSNAALTVNAVNGALSIDGTVNSLADTALSAAQGLTVTGALQSAGSLALTSGASTAIVGTVNALSDATLHAGADTNVSGTLHATGPLSVVSGGTLAVGGELDSSTDASLSATQALTVDGTVYAGGKLDMQSGGTTTLNGIVSSAGVGTLQSAGDVAVGGTLQSAGALDLTSGGNTTIGGALVSSGDMTLHNVAGSLTSTGTLQSGGNLLADASGTVDLGSGRTTALGNLAIKAGADIRAAGTVLAQGSGTLTAGGALAGAGALSFGGAATLQSGGDTSLSGSLAGDTVAVSAGGNAALHDVSANGLMTLGATGSLQTSGSLIGNADIVLNAGTDIEHSGTLQAVGNVQLDAKNGQIASTGAIATNGTLLAQAGTDITLDAATSSQLDTTLTAGRDIAINGALTTGAAFAASAGANLGVSGSVLATADATLDAGSSLDVTGTLEGHGNGTLNAGLDLTGAGTIAFAQATNIDAARDVVQGGLVQGNDVTVRAAGNASVNNVQADSTLSLRADGKRTDTGPGNLTINGSVYAGGAIDAQAANDLVVAAALQGATTVGLDAGQNVTIGGSVQSGGAMTIAAQTGDLLATGGINSGAALNVTTGRDLTLGATTSAVGDATLSAGRDLVLGSGLLIGEAGGTLLAGRDITGTGTQSFTQGLADVEAQRNVLLGGLLQADAVRVQGGNDATLNNIASLTTLDLKALGLAGNGDVTVSGTAQAAGDVSVSAAHDIGITGTLANGATQTLDAGSSVSVSGTSQSAGDMKIVATAGSVQLAGTTTAGGALSAQAALDVLLDGTIAATGSTSMQAGRDIDVNGSLAGQADGALNAGQDIAGAGSLAFAQAATLDATHDLGLSGTLQGASVSASAGNNAGLGAVQAVTGDLSVIASGQTGGGDVTIGGAATAVGNVTLQAARDIAIGGALNAGGATHATAARNLSAADLNSAGDLTLTAANGNVSTGNVTTQGNLAASAGQSLDLNGQTQAGGNAALTSGADMTLAGGIAAQGAGTLAAGGALNAASVALGQQATLSAGSDIAVSGSVATNGALSAAAGNSVAMGSATAGGAVSLQANGLASAGGAGDIVVTSGVTSGAAMQVDAARDVNVGGALSSVSTLDVEAGRDVSLNGATIANGAITLNASTGNLTANGTITTGGKLAASAGANTALMAGALVNGDTSVAAGAGLTLNGAFLGLGAGSFTAASAIAGGASLTYVGDLGIQAGGAATLGAIETAGNFAATSGADMSLGATTAEGDIDLESTGGSVAVSGALQGGGNVIALAANNVTLAGGVASVGSVTVTGTAGNVSVNGVSANADATFVAGQTLALSGTSVVAGNLGLSGGNVTLSGSISSTKNIVAGAQGTLDASQASIVASQNLQLTGSTVSLGQAIVGGTLGVQASSQLNLTGGDIDVVGNTSFVSQGGFSNAASVLAGGDLTVSGQGVVNAANASLASVGTLTINAGNLTNAGLVNGATTNVSVSGALNNRGGSLMGLTALNVTTGTLDNTGGLIFAGNPQTGGTAGQGNLSLTINGGGAAFANVSGSILAQGNLSFSAPNMNFDPTQGTISQGGALSITASTIDINNNWNFSGTSVTLDGVNGVVNNGTLNGTAALTLTTNGTFTNNGQVSGNDVTINGTLNNVSGALVHAGDVLAINGNVTNRGTVEAGSALNVTGGNYDNAGATTQSQGDVAFNLNGTLQNTGGSIIAGNSISISASAVVNDQAASGGAGATGGSVTNVVSDIALLWSGQVGWLDEIFVGTDLNLQHVSEFAMTLGQALQPIPSSWLSGSIIFNEYVDANQTSTGGSLTVWAPATSIDPAAVASTTIALPTVYQTTNTAQPGAQGVISAGNSISLTANSLSNQGGEISAQNNAILNIQSLSNGSSSAFDVAASTFVNQSDYTAFLSQIKSLGLVAWGDDADAYRCGASCRPMQYQLDSIDLSSVAPTTAGTVSYTLPTGLVAAGGNLTIAGGDLVNAGMLYAGNNVQIDASSLSNQGGSKQNSSTEVGCASGVPGYACGTWPAPGNNPTTTTFSFTEHDATIMAGNDLIIAAGSVKNTDGNLLAGHDVVIGGVGSTANSTTPAQTLNNTSGNIVAGNNVTLNVSGAITNDLPPPVSVYENYGMQQQYAGCMTGGGYKQGYCQAYVDQQSGSSSTISAGNSLIISAGSLTNIGSLISAGNSATISVTGPIVNEAQTLNAYWHSYWVQETGLFSRDISHNTWGCGSAAECAQLYGATYTNVGGVIDPPTPVGNIAATIEAPNLSVLSSGQIQNVGNVLGTSVSLTGQKLINGITTTNTYTPTVSAPSQVITLNPVSMPGLNIAVPMSIGSGQLSASIAGQASYVQKALSGSSDLLGPQQLLDALPTNLQPTSTLFYYNPQEQDLLLKQAALQQTGEASFVNTTSTEQANGLSVSNQQTAVLYQNAVNYAEKNEIQLGTALTQTQIDALTEPMLWYVEQTVPDPSCSPGGLTGCPTITALMPQVYLPAGYSALSAGGNIEADENLALNFGDQSTGGSILNTGTIASGGALDVSTGTLKNQANQVNVGQIWNTVGNQEGYTVTTGTEVQPGGFMSAADMTLNVETLNQIGGALQQLDSNGGVDTAGTLKLVAQLQQQLGGSFTQQTLSDNLHTDFVAEGGGMPMFVVAAIAVAASIMTAGAAAAAMGVALASMTLAESIAVGALSGMAGSAASQLASGSGFGLAAVLEAGAIGAITAGVTNGITYNSATGSIGFSGWNQSLSALPTGTSTLGQLAGIASVGNAVTGSVPQAAASVASLSTEIAALGATATINAGVETAIDGGSFLDNLRNSAVSDGAAVGAYAIGNLAPSLMSQLGETGGELAYLAAHAALGCVASAADGTGCAGGAIGGAASAALSPDLLKAIDPTGAALDSGQLAALAAFATVAGGGLASLAGQNEMAGATAGQNEALNNDGSTPIHTADAVKNGGLGSAALNVLYSFLPWLPGNPVAQATWQAASSTAKGVMSQIQANYGGQPPPADPNSQVPGGDDSNTPHTGAAPATSISLALCMALTDGLGCGGLMVPVSATSGGAGNGTSTALQSSNGGTESTTTQAGMPSGYVANGDGTVTGPRGATYTPTGVVDASGSAIYIGANGNYYTLTSNGASRVVSPNPSPQIGVTGTIGQNALNALGGQPQVPFSTSLGTRVVDLMGMDGVANEAKVGYTSLDSDTALQVAKDAELIKTGAVSGVTWNFYTSPVTGRGGPSAALLKALQSAGIQVKIN